ncbi:MAG: cytochrome b/b6 domain-containing protein [Rubrivivax sp.]|nr:cytochrome b/b6 domain-containing protein [Rubrivivax sp.]
MRALLERLSGALHLTLAVSCLWLLASSPWLRMVRHLPASPGFVNLAHVVVGVTVALLLPVYLVHCSLGQRRQLCFPWLTGHMDMVKRDLIGLARGRLPAAEGGGLLAMLEGLLLLSLLATAMSGTGWLLAQGSQAALTWYDVHVICSRVFAGLLLAHVLGVSLHLLDFVRN